MKLKSHITFSFLLVVSVYFLNGCSPKKPITKSGKLNIIATTGMVADAVRNVGGDFVDVTALMGPGVDPHLYKASEGDVGRLAKADVIVYNGLHLEGKMGEILEKMARTKVVIPAAEVIPDSLLTTPPEFAGLHDPHVWFDLELWAMVVTGLGESLGKADTSHREAYLKQAKDYAAEVLARDREVLEQISTIPEERRVLITAHDAFNYFGRAYHIEVKGLQGVSTVSEYGLKDVTDMVDLIVTRKIKAIFVETSISSKSIEAVQAGVRGKGHEVTIGGTLYSDALGTEGTPAGTYLGMVKTNVETIVNALK